MAGPAGLDYGKVDIADSIWKSTWSRAVSGKPTWNSGLPAFEARRRLNVLTNSTRSVIELLNRRSHFFAEEGAR